MLVLLVAAAPFVLITVHHTGPIFLSLFPRLHPAKAETVAALLLLLLLAIGGGEERIEGGLLLEEAHGVVRGVLVGRAPARE